VVRPVVQSIELTRGEHVVCMSDASRKGDLITMLNAFHDQQFRVYAFDVAQNLGNCEFKKTSTMGFLQDLRNCTGVIATAGFALLSECLDFRKRMLVPPIQVQCEQMINARYAERLGVVLHHTSLNAATLVEHLDAIEQLIPNDRRILWPDNRGFFDLMHRTLHLVCSQR
jgi:uncharacterized protein (TIGR00661 family)